MPVSPCHFLTWKRGAWIPTRKDTLPAHCLSSELTPEASSSPCPSSTCLSRYGPREGTCSCGLHPETEVQRGRRATDLPRGEWPQLRTFLVQKCHLGLPGRRAPGCWPQLWHQGTANVLKQPWLNVSFMPGGHEELLEEGWRVMEGSWDAQVWTRAELLPFQKQTQGGRKKPKPNKPKPNNKVPHLKEKSGGFFFSWGPGGWTWTQSSWVPCTACIKAGVAPRHPTSPVGLCCSQSTQSNSTTISWILPACLELCKVPR